MSMTAWASLQISRKYSETIPYHVLNIFWAITTLSRLFLWNPDPGRKRKYENLIRIFWFLKCLEYQSFLIIICIYTNRSGPVCFSDPNLDDQIGRVKKKMEKRHEHFCKILAEKKIKNLYPASVWQKKGWISNPKSLIFFRTMFSN